MRTVIFLDIDGVLNCSETKDMCGRFRGIEDEKVSYLKEIADYTNGEIILSSSWRCGFLETAGKREKNLAKYLISKLEKFGLRVSGMTPDIAWRKRGEEIQKWLESNGSFDRVIILDDEAFSWGKLHGNWVCTVDEEEYFYPGLSKKHVKYVNYPPLNSLTLRQKWGLVRKRVVEQTYDTSHTAGGFSNTVPWSDVPKVGKPYPRCMTCPKDGFCRRGE